MPSVMAIVSKAVFEKQGGAVGEVYQSDGYASLHKSLDALGDGGSIFLVTVRPPDEALWLVGVIDAPKRGKTGWTGAANATPIRDISAVKSKLVFSTGTGITAKPGALGMSLQTPRVLTAADEALLRGGRATRAAAKPAAVKAPAKKDPAAKPAPVAESTHERSFTSAGAPGPAAVLAALQAKDSPGALVATLAWWRASQAPEVADLLDAISTKVSGAPETDQANWAKLARTADPVVLGRLLAGVPELPTSFLPVAAEMLAGFAPDPRIATALATWVFDPPTTSSSTHAFWTKTLDLVGKTGDARHLAAFKKRLKKADGTSQFWDKLFSGIEKLLKKLAAVPAATAPTAKLLAAVQKLPPIDERRASGIVAARVAANAPIAPTLTGPLLDQAAQHLAAGRVEAAIDAMAAHWREHRTPEVADLIDRATRLLPTWYRPLATDAKELHAAWQAAMRTPGATMPQLLQNLAIGTVKEIEVRMVDLANLPDDPRISMRLAQLSRHAFSPERAQIWKSLFSLLARHRDLRTVAPLLKEFDNFVSKYYYHHQHGKRLFGPFAFAPGEFPVPHGDGPRIDALAKALDRVRTPAQDKERELIAAIVAAPDDDAPRAVYADWLIEQGHPRGELINTALAGGDTKALVQTPFILGAIGDLPGTIAELHRGLPTEVEPAHPLPQLLVQVLRDEPLAAVVQRLVLESFRPDDGQALADGVRTYLDVFPNVVRIVKSADPRALLGSLEGWRRDGDDLVR